MVPLCTLLCPLRKINFSQDSRIYEVQVRKSYFVPFEPIEWLENFTWPRQTWSLEAVSQIFRMCSGPSFIAKYNHWRAENSIAHF